MLPIVRIEIQGLQYNIAQMLTDHHKTLEKAVQEEIEKAIQQYPFEENVRRITHECITAAIKQGVQNHFSFELWESIDELVKNKIMDVLKKRERNPGLKLCGNIWLVLILSK